MNLAFESKIQEISSRIGILDVVSEVVSLKKSGSNFTGLCPFHNEKTPSFSVSPDKGLFYCFGCGTGGNVYTFLMKTRGLTFFEALQHLAKRAGVELPRGKLSPQETKQKELRKRIFEINEIALQYFQKLLYSSEGKEALDYLKGRRGLTDSAISTFRLGYSLDKWNGLLNFLMEKGIPMDLSEKAGLIMSRKGSGHYDIFRGRIIFPISDMDGNILGFGGRVLKQGEPKYLNTPESPVFSKGRSFYGLELAWQEVKRTGEVFVVEGYFDLIALVQAGVKNVLAPLGTALTPSHVNYMRGYVKRAYMTFDSDSAGMRASERVLPLFLDSGIDAFMVSLPEGDDPDIFIRREGAEQFVALKNGARLLWDFYLDNMVRLAGAHPWRKTNAVEEITKTILKVSHPVVRSVYIKQIAERFGVSEQVVLSRLRNAGRKMKQSQEEKPSQLLDKKEAMLICIILKNPGAIEKLKNYIDDIENHQIKAIAELLLENYINNRRGDVDDLLAKIDNESLRDSLVKIIFESEPIPDTERAVNAIKKDFELRRIKDEERRLTMELSKWQSRGMGERIKDLLVLKNELIKRKQELLKRAV